MGRYAVIEDGVVVNIIVWDGESEYDPGDGVTLVEAGDYNIGDEI